jgi:hypothetical protein
MELQRYIDCGAVFAEDLGSNNSKFTYTGTGLTNSPYGRARTFNGDGDFVTCSPCELNMNNSDFTIVARLYLVNNSTQSVNRICKLNNTITFGIDKATRKLGSFINIGGSDTGSWTDGPVVSSNTWVDVAVVFNNTTQEKTYYVNGVASSPVSVGVSPSQASDGLITIGGVSGAFNNWFSGNIQELIVEKRRWSATELLNYTQNKVFDYDKSIVARYNLDDTTTVKDLGWRKLGNDGTVFGTPTLENSPFGQSLKFDGDGDYVEVGNQYNDLTSDLSVSAWAYVNNPADDGYQQVVGRDNNNVTAPWYMGYRAMYNFFIAGNFGGSWRGAFLQSPEIEKGWHHIVFTHITGEQRLFLDGVEVDNDSYGDIISSSEELKIGANNPLRKFFSGSIDKVMIFDKALTGLEVKDLYNRTLRGDL